MNLHLAIISKDISAKNENAVSEVKRMVRMPEEDSKNLLTRLAEEIKKKNRCNDEEEAQSDATELEEDIKDTIKRNVLKY